MSEKFIKNFSIEIGQDSFRSHPPMITFKLNDRFVTVKLEDMKDWFNTIWDSQGDRNEEAYKAKRQLDRLFNELINPFVDFSKQIIK